MWRLSQRGTHVGSTCQAATSHPLSLFPLSSSFLFLLHSLSIFSSTESQPAGGERVVGARWERRFGGERRGGGGRDGRRGGGRRQAPLRGATKAKAGPGAAAVSADAGTVAVGTEACVAAVDAEAGAAAVGMEAGVAAMVVEVERAPWRRPGYGDDGFPVFFTETKCTSAPTWS
uniref:DUF834 domain-containing protein n=1 Tax=Oryza rufipogon TaxID=4529 RepID=A0A0E0Q3J3_ORYRU